MEAGFGLIIGLIIVLILVIMKLIFYSGTKKDKDNIKFDEFDDIEKVKEQEKKEKVQMEHEANVLDTVYSDSFIKSLENNINKNTSAGETILYTVKAHFDAMGDTEKAKKDLYNFKVLDSVEVEKDKITEGHQINRLRENGINFEVELFKKWSSQIFGCIKAGEEEQLNVVKNFISEELYGRFLRQEKQFANDGLKFVTDDLIIEKCILYDYSKSMDKEEIKILVNASMKEYIIQKNNNQVIRGSKDKIYKKSVIMTFVKKNIEEGEGIIHNCPNCGSEIQQTEFGKCPYCRTLILPIRYNWTLIKFETV